MRDKKGGVFVRGEWNVENNLLFMFDAYCRKVIKFNGCAKRRDENRQESKTLDCVAFDETIMNTLYVEDQYQAMFSSIILPNISVMIDDENLFRNLQLLSKKRQEILLLSYFMEMSDSEIGKLLNLRKSTVQDNRSKALSFLRDNMKGRE